MLHLDPLLDRPITVCTASSCAASTMTLARASIGKRVSAYARTLKRRARAGRPECMSTHRTITPFGTQV
jgi:hypothetical protein